ncbi:hypothetical protein OOZ63_27635 [Paucibacter sp. PLA-PC-4]|uniref:FHA domain-containing protein n=1 Tax=Paucibacter sp. PLA-PC-4 TaxID=2993655 RepID=UPI00224B7616|nr:FHA domain-containing protein [Paucibacter sp. PLA-PC-4]MCX2865600.1 hypothetical protein [Paucibacter sp. PLA-PC-4]
MTDSTVLRLRVLSGTHAGASVDLAHGHYSIGADPTADLALADWTFAPLELVIDATGAYVRWAGPRAGRRKLTHAAPIAFAGVVICAAPVDSVWPDDTELLDAAVPAIATFDWRAGCRHLRKSPARLVSAIAVALAVLGVAGWLVSSLFASAPPPPTLLEVRDALQQDLAAAGLPKLLVSVAGSTLVVQGLVDDDSQARAVSQGIERSRGQHAVVQRLSTAAQVADAIREGLGIPSADVRYRAEGVFTVRIRTSDVGAAQAAVDRVAADLSSLVVRIEPEIEPVQTAPTRSADVRSTLLLDGLSIVESTNGTKHLVLTPASPDRASDPASSPSANTVSR